MEETPSAEKASVRLERRKGISFNFKLRKSPSGYPVFLRITEDGKHLRYKTTITLSKKSDWDSKKQKIKYSEPNRDSWQGELDQLLERAIPSARTEWSASRWRPANRPLKSLW